VDATVERFVGIDNAGIAYTGQLASAPVEQVERTLAVNFLGVWRTDRALIEQITQRKGYLLKHRLAGEPERLRAGLHAAESSGEANGPDPLLDVRPRSSTLES
jgi:NAD(P)-dependent dehydrogenase (short-subunit alcohol dehydrogenase family)